MFKLESYITPLILSRVEKYVKNVRSEDSQVSLWGGDASLTNLDLKLDVLEEELKLPFKLVSGNYSWCNWNAVPFFNFNIKITYFRQYNVNLYKKAFSSYEYINMLAIAGQTAGPNWLTFFREPMDTLWLTEVKKIFSSKINFFQDSIFFISTCKQ